MPVRTGLNWNTTNLLNQNHGVIVMVAVSLMTWTNAPTGGCCRQQGTHGQSLPSAPFKSASPTRHGISKYVQPLRLYLTTSVTEVRADFPWSRNQEGVWRASGRPCPNPTWWSLGSVSHRALPASSQTHPFLHQSVAAGGWKQFSAHNSPFFFSFQKMWRPESWIFRLQHQMGQNYPPQTREEGERAGQPSGCHNFLWCQWQCAQRYSHLCFRSPFVTVFCYSQLKFLHFFQLFSLSPRR